MCAFGPAEEDGARRVYHAGQGLGFTALNLLWPEQKLALVVLANTSVTGTVNTIADRLTYLLVRPGPKEVLARKVFAELAAGRVDALFTAELR